MYGIRILNDLGNVVITPDRTNYRVRSAGVAQATPADSSTTGLSFATHKAFFTTSVPVPLVFISLSTLDTEAAAILGITVTPYTVYGQTMYDCVAHIVAAAGYAPSVYFSDDYSAIPAANNSFGMRMRNAAGVEVWNHRGTILQVLESTFSEGGNALTYGYIGTNYGSAQSSRIGSVTSQIDAHRLNTANNTLVSLMWGYFVDSSGNLQSRKMYLFGALPSSGIYRRVAVYSTFVQYSYALEYINSRSNFNKDAFFLLATP